MARGGLPVGPVDAGDSLAWPPLSHRTAQLGAACGAASSAGRGGVPRAADSGERDTLASRNLSWTHEYVRDHVCFPARHRVSHRHHDLLGGAGRAVRHWLLPKLSGAETGGAAAGASGFGIAVAARAGPARRAEDAV